MPFIGYNGDGDVVAITRSDDGAWSVIKKTKITGGLHSVASAGDDAFYFIPKETPSLLHRWSFVEEKGELVQDLFRPVRRLFFHHNKVFCVPLDASGVAVYDPLCNVVERLPIEYVIKWIEPADHGFVFRTACGNTFGYDMNNGPIEVANGDHITAFLGHYKRYAVVRLNDGSAERLAGVTETGEMVECVTGLPNAYFAECDDIVLHIDDGDIVSPGGRRVPSLRNMRLTASPASGEEVTCSICLCEFDDEGGVTLDCGHRFHRSCIEQWVSTWMDFAAKGEHITFTHAVCASGCKYLIRHPLILESKRIAELFLEVTAKKSAMLPQFEATKTDEDLLFYICCKCSKAFYGGERVCSRMQGREPSSSPDDLICDTCLASAHDGCSTFAPVFKCRYCCNPATQRSFGTRYMCERCNVRWDTSEPPPIPCPGDGECPFDGQHEEGGGCYVGCLLCSCAANADHIFDRVVATKDGDAKANT